MPQNAHISAETFLKETKPLVPSQAHGIRDLKTAALEPFPRERELPSAGTLGRAAEDATWTRALHRPFPTAHTRWSPRRHETNPQKDGGFRRSACPAPRLHAASSVLRPFAELSRFRPGTWTSSRKYAS